MKLLFSAVVLSLLCSTAIHAQDFYPLKRKPYQLTLVVDKKTTYEENLSESTYLLPDLTLQLYPGELIYIEIEEENGVVKNVRAVEENKHPSKTLIISFTQNSKKKVHEQMTLHIENPFKYALKYDAKVYLVNYKKWINTGVANVRSGESASEAWPELVSSIAIADWHFIK